MSWAGDRGADGRSLGRSEQLAMPDLRLRLSMPVWKAASGRRGHPLTSHGPHSCPSPVCSLIPLFPPCGAQANRPEMSWGKTGDESQHWAGDRQGTRALVLQKCLRKHPETGGGLLGGQPGSSLRPTKPSLAGSYTPES